MFTGVLIAVASTSISLGAVIKGLHSSNIVILCTAVVTFSFASIAVHTTSVVPNG